jgi:DNA-binding transcriptional MerR regulator
MGEGVSAGRMRMKQLMKAAGVTKATVQFYVREGLIPKPVKTSPNMAYYDQRHLNAIRLVRELQAKRFLPLSIIKRLIQGGQGDLSVHEIRTLVEMDGKLFRNLQENPDVQPVDAEELARRTGVTEEEIRAFERIRILHPIRRGRRKLYDSDDILFVECYGKLRKIGYTKSLGFSPEIFALHRQWLEVLVAEEGRILAEKVSGNLDPDEIVRMVEEGTAISNVMLGLIRKKLIVETVRRYAAEFRSKQAARSRGAARREISATGKDPAGS